MPLIDPRNAQAIVIEALRQSGFALSPAQQAEQRPERLVEALLEQRVARGARATAYRYVMEAVEKPLIEKALATTGGNQLAAARLLGINRNTLRARMKALGVRVAKPA
jgi:two-component system nitrogen regulation response regulator GlnG